MKLETAAKKYYQSKQNKADKERFIKFLEREKLKETDKKRLKLIDRQINIINGKRTVFMKLRFLKYLIIALKNMILRK